MSNNEEYDDTLEGGHEFELDGLKKEWYQLNMDKEQKIIIESLIDNQITEYNLRKASNWNHPQLNNWITELKIIKNTIKRMN